MFWSRCFSIQTRPVRLLLLGGIVAFGPYSDAHADHAAFPRSPRVVYRTLSSTPTLLTVLPSRSTATRAAAMHPAHAPPPASPPLRAVHSTPGIVRVSGIQDPTPAQLPDEPVVEDVAPPPLPEPLPQQLHTLADDAWRRESWPVSPNSIPWEIFAQGEYIGPARTPHLPEYRIRVDDSLQFVYRLTRDTLSNPYQLKVGDVLKVESLTSERINHTVTVEPDGMISLPIAGRISATGLTVDQLRSAIDKQVGEQIRDPAISVIPQQLDQRLEELRASVDNRSAAGGQSFEGVVAPDGTIQLPGIGSLSVAGLSIPELHSEVTARYNAAFPGVEVTAVLKQRAARHVYVLGEVRNAGRFSLVAPTTALQALSLAGGYEIGADLTNIIVLRRDENWRLIACRIDLKEDLNGECIDRSHDVWLRDSDILLVPKSTCQKIDEYIDLVLTRGLYSVIPVRYAVNYTRISN